MERLTAYDGNYYYPHCMRGNTCDGRGPSEKCKECEFDDRICVTLGKYEDTGLTPQEIMELKEQDTAKDLKDLEKENVAKDELRKSFVNHIADILIGLNGAAKTETEKELVFSIAVTVKDNIEFIPDGEES